MTARRSNIVVRIIRGIVGSLSNSIQGFGNLFSRPAVKKRRNADFEKAGREVQSRPPAADRKSTAQINRANIERDLEVLNAIKQEKKMLRARGPEAEQYRKAKENDNVEVSRGEVISHLAAMQRKAAEKKRAEKKAAAEKAKIEETTEQGDSPHASSAPRRNGHHRGEQPVTDHDESADDRD